MSADALDNFEVISTYTRRQAIEDGMLIDVSATAKDAGFSIPVAISAGVQAECVTWSDDEQTNQDEVSRLWDVVYLAGWAARDKASYGLRQVLFPMYRIARGDTKATRVHLKMDIGPGDSPEPVVTIMLPTED